MSGVSQKFDVIKKSSIDFFIYFATQSTFNHSIILHYRKTMTHPNSMIPFSFHVTSLTKGVVIGGLIALVLISLFLLGASNPPPAWGEFWMIKPLIIVPLAGAAGGAFFSIVAPFHYRSTWKKALALLVCLLVFMIGLWLGTVLGLNGTYWN